MTRGWMITTVLVAVGATAGGALYVHQRNAKAAAATLPTDTTRATVAKGDITQSVSSTGQVVSNLDVLIKCRASGEIIKLPFDISDHVKKGNLLLQLDTTDEQRAVDLAQVMLDQAKAKLKQSQNNETMGEQDLVTATEKADANIISAQIKADNLRRKADRQKQLLAQKLASNEDYETSETDAAQAANDLESAKIAREELKSQQVALEVKKQDVELAQQQVKSSQVSLDIAHQSLTYTTINAPMDGVISSLSVEIGTIISSAISNVGGGSTVMTLSDLSRIFVLGSVDESDIGGVQLGQEVNITADAFPGKKFHGKVMRIATTGVNTNNVVTFEVKIEVTSKNKNLLKPTMTTNVEIVEAQNTGTLLVPVQAVVQKKHKNYVAVVKADGSTEDREVTIGATDNVNDEIVSGLSEGDTILVHKDSSSGKWSASGGPRPGGMMGMPGGGGGRK